MPTRTQVARAKKAFLEAYAKLGIVTSAAQEAGIARKSVYNWRNADADFATSMDEAGEQATDLMEREARRRGVEGTEKPVYQGGGLVGTIREYSDTLLIFMLKARRPEKFRDKPPTVIDVTAQSGASIYLPERKSDG